LAFYKRNFKQHRNALGYSKHRRMSRSDGPGGNDGWGDQEMSNIVVREQRNARRVAGPVQYMNRT
jgi:hypothetical protein